MAVVVAVERRFGAVLVGPHEVSVEHEAGLVGLVVREVVIGLGASPGV